MHNGGKEMKKRKFPWLPLIVVCLLVLGYAVLGNRSTQIPEEHLTVGITPTVLYDEQGTVEPGGYPCKLPLGGGYAALPARQRCDDCPM